MQILPQALVNDSQVALRARLVCLSGLQLWTFSLINVTNFVAYTLSRYPLPFVSMSGTARNDSMADDAEDTPNNVQSNKATEYILNEMWKRIQASANESSKMAKALELSNYRASIYQAQAEAYKEAANSESEGTRSGFMTRGMALGVLAG